MAVYIEKYDGYIADNPNIDFERCDGKVFSYYEVNTASMNNTANQQTITGGQGNYPLCYIDTDKTLELTFESSQFTLDMFMMANAVNGSHGDYGTLETKLYDVKAGSNDSLVITIPYQCEAGSVKIRGFEEETPEGGATAPTGTGKFIVAITAAGADTAGSTVITFYTDDVVVDDTLRVSYRRRIVDSTRVSVNTNSTVAKGALYAHWPIYSSGTDLNVRSFAA